MTDDPLHGLDEDLRPQSDWWSYVVLLLFVVAAIFIALFFLRNGSRGLFSDAASSVSNAPGP